MLARVELGLSLKAGTLGAGIEGTIGILDNVNTRLGFNYWSMESDITESNVEYELVLDLMSISLLLDWHPVNNGFRLSIGTLSTSIDFDDFAPYIGIGYGNAVGKSKKWNFVMDLGVMYQGNPDVTKSTFKQVNKMDISPALLWFLIGVAFLFAELFILGFILIFFNCRLLDNRNFCMGNRY